MEVKEVKNLERYIKLERDLRGTGRGANAVYG
jgi:hypothetical protein